MKISIEAAEVAASKDMSNKKRKRCGESPLSDGVIGPVLKNPVYYLQCNINKKEYERRIKELEYMDEVLMAKCRQYHTKMNKIIWIGKAAQNRNEMIAKRADSNLDTGKILCGEVKFDAEDNKECNKVIYYCGDDCD